MARLKTLKPRVALLATKQLAASAAAKRIRGSALQRIRERVLSSDPLCTMCKARGIISAATQVDHITALANGGHEDKHDDANRQGLCDACHDAKTAEDLAIARGQSAGIVGGG